MPEDTHGPRRSFVGIILTVIVVLSIGGLAYYFRDTLPFGGGDEPKPAPQEEQQAPQLQTYQSPSMGISVRYPGGWTLNAAYAYDQFGQNKLIHGIKLTIPAAMATGTNLSADSYVSVEQLPRAQNCTGDIYLLANVRAAEVVEGVATYSMASSTEAAAGNRFEEQVWALKGSRPCTAVRYFIHTTELANYEPGTVRAYDRAALLAEFDSIRRSLQIEPTATSTPTP